MKKCSNCKEIKKVQFFSKNSIRKDGYENWCKDCNKKRSIIYYQKNKSKWKKSSPESIKESSRKYYLKNRERIIENQKRYYENNKEKVIEYRKKYQRSEIGLLKMKVKLQRRRLQARMTNDKTINDSSIQELFEKQDKKCALCKKELTLLSKLTHLDHIIPLVKGGVHSIKNIQITCSRCNLSKGDKII